MAINCIDCIEHTFFTSLSLNTWFSLELAFHVFRLSSYFRSARSFPIYFFLLLFGGVCVYRHWNLAQRHPSGDVHCTPPPQHQCVCTVSVTKYVCVSQFRYCFVEWIIRKSQIIWLISLLNLKAQNGLIAFLPIKMEHNFVVPNENTKFGIWTFCALFIYSLITQILYVSQTCMLLQTKFYDLFWFFLLNS